MPEITPLKAILVCLLLSGSQPLFADQLDNPELPDLIPQIAPAQNRVRVALVDSGVNYLLPKINAGLARLGDGKLLGYDFWDMDALPFDSHPDARGGVVRHGTRTASLLLKEAPFVELVAYRYPRPDMQRMTDLIAHADKHKVRVIGLPLGGNLLEPWLAFEAAAKAHPHILFVASAGNNGRDIDQTPVYPAALTLDNMLVVTSADHFGRVANGVNWGRSSVDYMVPAESLKAQQFDGSHVMVSGSSYAVPRVVALAARYMRDDPALSASQIIKLIRQRFANGAMPRQLAQGYLGDPQYARGDNISVVESYPFNTGHSLSSSGDEESVTPANASSVSSLNTDIDETWLLPLQVLVLDERWQMTQLKGLLKEAEGILGQCSIAFAPASLQKVQSPDYLRDLETGAARTLMDAVRESGAERKLTIVFARDTLMNPAFDAEAFGRGNTRQRAWLTDSVWLTLALEDRAIALAHELFHVLVNSGQHSDVEGSLMLARTTGSNTHLSEEDCALAKERGVKLGLLAQAITHINRQQPRR